MTPIILFTLLTCTKWWRVQRALDSHTENSTYTQENVSQMLVGSAHKRRVIFRSGLTVRWHEVNSIRGTKSYIYDKKCTQT